MTREGQTTFSEDTRECQSVFTGSWNQMNQQLDDASSRRVRYELQAPYKIFLLNGACKAYLTLFCTSVTASLLFLSGFQLVYYNTCQMSGQSRSVRVGCVAKHSHVHDKDRENPKFIAYGCLWNGSTWPSCGVGCRGFRICLLMRHFSYLYDVSRS